MEQPNWGEAFYEHLIKFLGKPSGRQIFEQDRTGTPIQILEFSNVFPDCKVFCSFGASAYSKALGIPAEVILPCDGSWNAAGKLLANSLFYLIQNQMKIGQGLSVGGLEKIDNAFVKASGKSAIYFTNPFDLPSAFNCVKNNEDIGRIFTAFFISHAEREYFCNYGANKFEALLQQAKVDPYNIDRKSCV